MSMGFPDDGTTGDWAYGMASDNKRKLEQIDARITRLEQSFAQLSRFIEAALSTPPQETGER